MSLDIKYNDKLSENKIIKKINFLFLLFIAQILSILALKHKFIKSIIVF
jgi:hypothetical protein